MDRKKLIAALRVELKELQRLLADLQKEEDDFDLWVYLDDCDAIGNNLISLAEEKPDHENDDGDA